MNKRILLDITYSDDSEKFCLESIIRNKVVNIDSEKSIHAQIAEICKNSDYAEFTYKGKPQGNAMIDTKDGQSKAVGYVYKCKAEVEVGNAWKTAYFTVWAILNEVIDYQIEEIEPKN